MFTIDCVKAEVTYRRERLTRDYRRPARRTGARRRWALCSRVSSMEDIITKV